MVTSLLAGNSHIVNGGYVCSQVPSGMASVTSDSTESIQLAPGLDRVSSSGQCNFRGLGTARRCFQLRVLDLQGDLQSKA